MRWTPIGLALLGTLGTSCALIDALGTAAPALDAPSDANGPPSTIEVVSPCGGESQTVTLDDSSQMFMPMTSSIAPGQIVKFVIGGTHDVSPLGGADDPGLRVPSGQTKCLRFTQSGTFNFKCTPHGNTGTITVQ